MYTLINMYVPQWLEFIPHLSIVQNLCHSIKYWLINWGSPIGLFKSPKVILASIIPYHHQPT